MSALAKFKQSCVEDEASKISFISRVTAFDVCVCVRGVRAGEKGLRGVRAGEREICAGQ